MVDQQGLEKESQPEYEVGLDDVQHDCWMVGWMC